VLGDLENNKQTKEAMKKLLIFSFAAASLLTLTPTAYAAEQQSPEKTACIHGVPFGQKCVKCELLAKKPAKEQEPKKEKEPTKEVEPAKVKEPAKEGEPTKESEPAKVKEPTKEGEPAKV
jgi:hypothetical protein